MKSIINEPSTDFHLRINEESFSIPAEILKRNLNKLERSVKLRTDEISVLLNKVNELMDSNTLENDKSAVLEINKIIKKVDRLEKELLKTKDEEYDILMRIQERISFFKELEHAKSLTSRELLIGWYQKYTNLLIGDYLVRNSKSEIKKDDDTGCYNNDGSLFLKQQHMEKLLDYDIIINANIISNSLIKHNDIGPLLTWIHDNTQYLKSIKSTLDFDARLQEYLQLLSKDNYKEAINCFQLHLVKFISTHSLEIQQAAGFLLYHKSRCIYQNGTTNNPMKTPINSSMMNTEDSSKYNSLYLHFFNKELPTAYKEHDAFFTNSETKLELSGFGNLNKSNNYSNLFDECRWKKLNDIFLREYYQMYGISKNEPLLIYLSLGISSLKTKDCLHKKEITTSENKELDFYLNSKVISNKCPVCSNEFRNIAKEMPYAHHIESILYENPIMLPNGNVYDKEQLEKLAAQVTERGLYNISSEEIIDPIDKQVYLKSSFVKMYPT
ncbi:hypothetical protein TPHA_0D01550 [Tetrapisispora phaffii CBS 4417]|uniref:Uncharacterized protein n=1 Tax=Tetrapisispora phaffii (strain ATCC 24235 / CBS 4417 / NBRC 1672 / NRRL Y-8282 / UCD 70-5) TaxID=1071381 RepID=G8BSH4_TETPH|nr:hypothetical protein TPHA_0D01550 [Tetrapisispora phaffii CBS 4417]CCE62795.1 hypothetical protein TPHA_0D01550 [Tetrapisispora phaffii CBS 4417]